jgi:dihydroorotate dehydrogenase
VNWYSTCLRPLFFKLDAECAHELALRFLAVTPRPLLRCLFGRAPRGKSRNIWGLAFPNPVGLAAGMDKSAQALPAWEALGFGFAEIGTITALPQPGNPKPRVFRYPCQKALINRMGFNNPGAETIARRLDALRQNGRWPKIPVGINIGKSKVTALEDAAADYGASARALACHAGYFAVNVSSPNTPGLRELQEERALRKIVDAIRRHAPHVPLLLKLAPDLPVEDAAKLATGAAETGFDGLIATNTTLARPGALAGAKESGGLSGAPLTAPSTEFLKAIAGCTSLPLIASGGVMDAESAMDKFHAGASLVQIYTGFVYSGPLLVAEIINASAQTAH